MKSEVKFSYKRKSKTYITIALLCVGIFVLAFITSLLFSKSMSTTLIMIIFITAFLVLVTGLVFNIISDMYLRRLVEYKNNICEYRIRREYCRALQLFNSKDLKEVVNIYNKHIPDKHRYKDLLYISLIHEFMHSEDETLKEKGSTKLVELIADNSPDHIHLFE